MRKRRPPSALAAFFPPNSLSIRYTHSGCDCMTRSQHYLSDFFGYIKSLRVIEFARIVRSYVRPLWHDVQSFYRVSNYKYKIGSMRIVPGHGKKYEEQSTRLEIDGDKGTDTTTVMYVQSCFTNPGRDIMRLEHESTNVDGYQLCLTKSAPPLARY